jgi:acetoin utilization protein AcuB
MLVKDQMTSNPICGHPDLPVAEAEEIMIQHKFRHLPIVDEHNTLVGMVTTRALASVLSSSGTRLSQHEVKYVLAKIKARDIMVTNVTTISEDTAIEEAARIMADEKIGCLPVMREGKLVGIITDNDLFAIMVNLLGSRRAGVRVTVQHREHPGEVARISRAIAEKNGNLSVYVTYPTEDPTHWVSVLKVTNLPEETLVETLSNLPDVRVQDVRKV